MISTWTPTPLVVATPLLTGVQLRNTCLFIRKLFFCLSLNFLKIMLKIRLKFYLKTLLKKRLWHRCFALSFAKFLRTSFLQKNVNGEKFKFHSNLDINTSLLNNYPSFYQEIFTRWSKNFASPVTPPSTIISQFKIGGS